MVSIEAEALPAFPAGENSRLGFPRRASRSATLADIPFLRQLYWSFRMEEMEPVPWLQEMKRAFIDGQFNLQHRHYVGVFSNADFLILQEKGKPIGRLYVDSTAERWHIIDIGFLPQWRNGGRGIARLKAIQGQAQTSGASGVFLHVERRNIRAQALYRRLQFREVEASDTHIGMQWSTA
ncbi:GNAT family N-acetyltransferase [Mesorhizobium caraganae]|uniref:GNAT family N-acetyltransferase n=1 Tax=Mesorhizobium caraganae TaxID=483206 RepID=UPI003ED017F3